MMQTVNLWLSKVGGTEGLDPEHGRAADLPVRPPLKRVSSGAAAGLSTDVVEAIDRSVCDDNETALANTLHNSEGELVSRKLLQNLLQRCITNKSLKCIRLLLGRVDTLKEEGDINGRNIIHRLVISIGRTKGLIPLESENSAGNTSLTVVPPQLFITPAESPIQTPPQSTGAIECDGVFRLSPNDESVKLLDYILSNLRPAQRGALADRDQYGRLALHYATQYGFVVLCRLIIKYMREWNQFDVSDGIDSANWQDADGYAPLHLAVIGEHPKTTLTLLQAENWDGGVGTTEQVVSARKTVSKSSAVLIMAARRNSVAIVQLLVEAGVDINYQDENGETALHHAARLGHVECVSALLAGSNSQRPDLELTEKTYGWTPLFVAAVEGKKEVAEALIDIGGCEVDKVDFSGWSAQEHAVLRGHLALAKMLIAKSSKSLRTGYVSSASPSPTPPLSSSPPLASTPFEKSISSTVSLTGSLEPTGSKPTPSTGHPHMVKSFGHRYLKQGQTMVLITLGSMDVRKNIQAVKLDQIPVYEAHTTQLDTALSLVVSAQGATGDPAIVDLPVHANVATDDPILFEAKDATKVKVMFDIVPTYAGSKDRIIGRAVALLGAVRPEVGKKRASLQGGIQVPILAVSTLEVIGSVNFEFTIITPFEHPNVAITKEHTYWKSLTTPRVSIILTAIPLISIVLMYYLGYWAPR